MLSMPDYPYTAQGHFWPPSCPVFFLWRYLLGVFYLFSTDLNLSLSLSLCLFVFLSVSLYIDTGIGVSINVDVAVDVAIDICWSAVYSYTYISTCMQYKYIAIYVCMCVLGCSVVSDSATTGYSPGKNAGVDCCGLLQDVCVYIDMYLCF